MEVQIKLTPKNVESILEAKVYMNTYTYNQVDL